MDCDLITLQYTEDSLRDMKKGSEKEAKGRNEKEREKVRGASLIAARQERTRTANA